MHLIKGKNWALSIHSFSYWSNVMRDPKDLPKIPYYKFFMQLPYDNLKLKNKQVTAHGTYLFPFAFRYFKEVTKPANANESPRD